MGSTVYSKVCTIIHIFLQLRQRIYLLKTISTSCVSKNITYSCKGLCTGKKKTLSLNIHQSLSFILGEGEIFFFSFYSQVLINNSLEKNCQLSKIAKGYTIRELYGSYGNIYFIDFINSPKLSCTINIFSAKWRNYSIMFITLCNLFSTMR